MAANDRNGGGFYHRSKLLVALQSLGKMGDLGPALDPWWSRLEPSTVEKPSCRKELQKCIYSNDVSMLVF